MPEPTCDARTIMSAMVREFLLDRQARNFSAGTLHYYRQKLYPFLQWLLARGVDRPAIVTAAHVRGFLIELQETDHNPGGQRAFFRAIRAWFNWLVEEGELDVSPMARLKSPRVPEEPLQPVPLDHVRKLLDACNCQMEIGCRNYALILCLLDTGLRAGEIMALNVSDLNTNDGSVLVRRSKSGRPRMVFVGAAALRALLRYLRHRGVQSDHAPLWATSEGKRLTYSGLLSMLRRLSQAAGVPTAMPHAFRRAFAILSLRNGADMYSLQRLMGHADLQVLRRYLKQTDTDLREAHRRTGPVDNLL